MAMLKNRKIYGISRNSGFSDIYVNFGESRYSYISYEDFFKHASTWKTDISTTNSCTWQPMIQNSKQLSNHNFDKLIKDLLTSMRDNNFISLNEKVAKFHDSSFLLETSELIPLKHGAISYKLIKTYKKHKIKFERNGNNGFSIWKDNILQENRIWTIAKCEEIINKI